MPAKTQRRVKAKGAKGGGVNNSVAARFARRALRIKNAPTSAAVKAKQRARLKARGAKVVARRSKKSGAKPKFEQKGKGTSGGIRGKITAAQKKKLIASGRPKRSSRRRRPGRGAQRATARKARLAARTRSRRPTRATRARLGGGLGRRRKR